ncbi:outer membrane beta-barrel protein [Emcibacter sp. SYSU 3D8]|uniref:outer membrane protein n=1 Tax=Emcibacter sp. SYSU 3D8 TaxID=3133969 RepID=UPI0031FE4B77
MHHLLRTTCVAAGMLGATVGMAVAQPASDRNPFDGFYVGGMVGYDSFHLDNASDLPDFDEENGGFITGLGSDGIAAGAVLGVNMPLSDLFIVGIEGTGRWSDASGNTSVSDNTSETSIEQGNRWSWGVMGRVGMRVSDGMMIYGSGGWGQTRFNTRFINTPAGGSPTTVFDDGVTRDAWRVGGGAEIALGGGWTGRLDYTYSNYGNYDVEINPTNALVVKPEAHQVSVGVSHYF